ncbi:M28 family metallopeptidase [Sulfuriroseicoccus oceanibius]|uniref:Zn-dependent exopeptidase M28 n=1 Tax=Sulfuriroseicoccus oceanibius TaxID=2707525 RepID=A0A6B3L1U9_9BACT|nr:M28 family metallopeptidase [Sulfuriroseicoccus oceanibius]QQL44291.1 Zn-dependent exopeptidase M28 [Sulfuriroseicoccus oceanibius]
MKMENLRFRFLGSEREDAVWGRPAKVLLGCHYDTKLYDEFEFVGANDGGSGCGLLMEMASVLAAKYPQLAREVELVFFDGEEAIGEDIIYPTTAGFDRQNAYDGLYGSHYYARQLRMKPRTQWPQAVVIVDMIGDRNLNIEIPANCNERLIDLALKSANEVGAGKFVGRSRSGVTDDHVPFHLLGIPVVNFIDFDFEPWHTEGDVLSTISSESLEVSGAVVVRFLQNFLLQGSQ